MRLVMTGTPVLRVFAIIDLDRVVPHFANLEDALAAASLELRQLVRAASKGLCTSLASKPCKPALEAARHNQLSRREFPGVGAAL